MPLIKVKCIFVVFLTCFSYKKNMLKIPHFIYERLLKMPSFLENHNKCVNNIKHGDFSKFSILVRGTCFQVWVFRARKIICIFIEKSLFCDRWSLLRHWLVMFFLIYAALIAGTSRLKKIYISDLAKIFLHIFVPIFLFRILSCDKLVLHILGHRYFDPMFVNLRHYGL